MPKIEVDYGFDFEEIEKLPPLKRSSNSGFFIGMFVAVLINLISILWLLK